jgi:ATP-dependent Lon protease
MNENLVEIQRLKDLINAKLIPDALKEYLQIMLVRVARSSQSGNYSLEYESVSRFIYWVASIPWGIISVDNLDIANARLRLEEEHYGMDVIKERIIEYIAVMNLLKQSGKSTRVPIICFVGLQGIGKTTMARSIAKSLGRSFERVSLGGMPSALELLGRSRSTPDAEPGQIIKAIIRSKTVNPVILLDEVEKCGNDAPSHASVMASLLEILDPEQNKGFMDHYIDFPIDLSNVIFILTANNLGPISTALIDRLEIIRLTGYTDEEKTIIAKKYLMPKVYSFTGVSPNQLEVSDEVWPNIIRPLGFEAGIRELERVMMGVGRKAAKQVLENPQIHIFVSNKNLHDYVPL